MSRSFFLRRLLPAIAVLLLIVAGILAGRYLYLRFRSSPAALTFAPAQPGEFLIIVAPFLRNGGDPQPIGNTLANDLRQAVGDKAAYRVEVLPIAPRANAIPDIIATYQPVVMVTGQYDGQSILARADFTPPAQPPPQPGSADTGSTALLPNLAQVIYEPYSPQGLDKPLAAVQAWITGQSAFWQGNYAEAANQFNQANAYLPRQVPVERRADMDRFTSNINTYLGYLAGLNDGNWQAARDYYSLAARQDPENLAASLGLGAALIRLNAFDQAGNLLRLTLRKHPDAWQVYFALAQLLQQTGDIAGALANYEQAIALLQADTSPISQSALTDIYSQRGYLHLTQDNPSAATADLKRAVELGRNDIFVQSNLAWAAYLANDHETAVRAAAEARRLGPDRPDLAFNEALLLLDAGQIDAANVAYDEAIKLTLTVNDPLTRSTYLGQAFHDLDELLARRPEIEQDIHKIQDRIEAANG